MIHQFSILKLTLIVLFLSSSSNASFESARCLNLNLNERVAHKAFPFGLTNTELEIEKVGCDIIINHLRLRYLKRRWQVDICRAPVHIKEGRNEIQVYKKGSQSQPKKSFLGQKKSIMKVVQDDGLIFAKGLKSRLEDPHGKIHCVSLLLKAYLNQGHVFTLSESPEDLELLAASKRIFSLPKKKELIRPVMEEVGPQDSKQGEQVPYVQETPRPEMSESFSRPSDTGLPPNARDF